MVGGGYIKNFLCRLGVTMNILSVGTSRLTGVDSDYIFDILNGSILPFETPLDCIELELLSFVEFRQNIFNNEIPLLRSKVQVSTSK